MIVRSQFSLSKKNVTGTCYLNLQKVHLFVVFSWEITFPKSNSALQFRHYQQNELTHSEGEKAKGVRS